MPPMMIPKQKPVNPAPLISPNCWPVNPKSAPQLARMPPRIPNPTPAARIARNPAIRSRLAFGAMATLLTSALLIVLCALDFCLNSERGQFYNRAPSEGRLVRAEADAGPVGGLLRVRKRIAIFGKSADELMHQVRVRTAVPCALGEAEMRFLGQIIDALGGEPANGFGQQFRVIGHFDLPGNFRFRQFGRVQHVRLMLDERPLERFFGAIDINAFAILPGGVEERAIDARAQIGSFKL